LLLEVEERAAVRRARPHLHDGGPLVGVDVGPAAGILETVLDGELDDVGLLHCDVVEDLAAEAEKELEALGVGLREDELRGGDCDAEAGDLALDAAEEDLHELWRLRCGADPGVRGLEVAGASRAVHHAGPRQSAPGRAPGAAPVRAPGAAGATPEPRRAATCRRRVMRRAARPQGADPRAWSRRGRPEPRRAAACCRRVRRRAARRSAAGAAPGRRLLPPGEAPGRAPGAGGGMPCLLYTSRCV
ncbi:hypothetical protein BAE44_0021484, partial [Dichanthelium oligosanthes]